MKTKLGCEDMYISFIQREATVLLARAVTTVCLPCWCAAFLVKRSEKTSVFCVGLAEDPVTVQSYGVFCSKILYSLGK